MGTTSSMYVNIHRPIRPFNEEFVDFWEASYEARLDDYALDILAPAIDHHFHPSLDSVSIANHYYTTASRYHKTKFVLSRDGKLIREELEETSLNAQFDEYARSALYEEALTLPPLPSGAARETDFMLQVSPDRIEVQPIILHYLWCSDFFRQLELTFEKGIVEWFRKNNPRKTPSIVDFSSFSYLLYFSNKEPYLRTRRPHPFTDDSLCDFMAAFLFRLELPPEFPNEMRFIVGVMAPLGINGTCEDRFPGIGQTSAAKLVAVNCGEKLEKQPWKKSYRYGVSVQRTRHSLTQCFAKHWSLRTSNSVCKYAKSLSEMSQLTNLATDHDFTSFRGMPPTRNGA